MEEILVASKPPDFNYLNGYGYDGFNCAPARYLPLPARKFRKVFFRKAAARYGLNQFVSPDDDDVTSQWNVRMKNSRPVEGGYFRVAPSSEPRSSKPLSAYRHLIGLDYNVDPNPKWNLLMRAIYDLVGLPNEGDYGVLLGKAYLRVLPGWYRFATYFVLGHRRPQVAD